MQTFLPSPGYEESASILDNKRLGKQRVENLQIMRILVTGTGGGWKRHPAVLMWKGYEASLLDYQYAICFEWHVMRGFKDTCLRKTMDWFWTAPHLAEDKAEPWWLGREDIHLSHRSNLLRKDPEWYGDFVFEKNLPDDLEYVWPEQ